MNDTLVLCFVGVWCLVLVAVVVVVMLVDV